MSAIDPTNSSNCTLIELITEKKIELDVISALNYIGVLYE